MDHDTDLVFGQIAKRKSLATQDQIDDAVEHQQVELQLTDEMPIGQILVELGYMSRQQVLEILRDQRLDEFVESERLFGQLCVTNGFVDAPDIVENALARQRQAIENGADDIPLLGEVLVSEGCLTLQQVNAVLKAQARLHEDVGRSRSDTKRIRRPV